MKPFAATILFAIVLFTACEYKPIPDNPVKGTWKLLSGTTISKGTTTVVDYTKNQEFMKIRDDAHFAFLKHDLNTPKDSTNHFDAGGGTYTIDGNKYVEHLDYCINKNWEGTKFDFTITFKGDTLVQQGEEKNAKENVNRVIIEKYIRIK